MESDKFLVEMFLPEGAKRCSYANAALVSSNVPHYPRYVSVLSRFPTFLFCALGTIQWLILFFFPPFHSL